MKNRYDEIMEHIEVTEDMRLRIQKNLQTISSEKSTSKSKNVRFFKKVLPFAACFVLLIGGFIIGIWSSGIDEPTKPSVQGSVNGIVTVSSPEELSACVNFKVFHLETLPFAIKEVTYTSYWNNMAAITYYGTDQSAVFRQSLGSEDNSGDYTSYTVTEKLTVGSLCVSLKGNAQQQFQLGVWSDDQFTFSLKLSDGVSLEEWSEIISHISL